MNRDLVLRRERPGDLEPTRALHDVAFGVPDGRRALGRDPHPGPAARRGRRPRRPDPRRRPARRGRRPPRLQPRDDGGGALDRARPDRGAPRPPGPGHRLRARGGGARHGRPRRRAVGRPARRPRVVRPLRLPDRRRRTASGRPARGTTGSSRCARCRPGAPSWPEPSATPRPSTSTSSRQHAGRRPAHRRCPDQRRGSDLERPPRTGNLGHRVWLGPGPGAELLAARRGATASPTSCRAPHSCSQRG